MADGCRRPCLAAPARQEEVRLVYTIKVCELITHIKKFKGTKTLVVEFRHASWWNEEVYNAFRKAGIIFCFCSGSRLPDELVRTADEVYLRLHGPKRWYRHDYSKAELTDWADRIKVSGAKHAWIYFNNDNDAHAPKNAAALRTMLGRVLIGKPSDGTLLVSRTLPEV